MNCRPKFTAVKEDEVISVAVDINANVVYFIDIKTFSFTFVYNGKEEIS
jgi:hypothetical protein